MSAGENVLAAALAAGIPLPHSCRAGRCATCKARLLAGEIAYPDDKLPPGIVASEAARGEVLLCQARPRSDLRIQTRTIAEAASASIECELLSVTELAFGTLSMRIRLKGGVLAVRPGQFVDVSTQDGTTACAAVVMREGIELVLEVAGPGSFGDRLAGNISPSTVQVSGPFDRPH